MAKVMAVCISEKKGTEKRNIHECEVIGDLVLKMMLTEENGIDR